MSLRFAVARAARIASKATGRSTLRALSSAPTSALVARYRKNGAVEEVIELAREALPPLSETIVPGQRNVLVKMLAAPLNPADFNMIEGVYSIKPPLPAIGGNEGVGVVLAVSDGTPAASEGLEPLRVGDRVIPTHPGFGTWRTHAVAPEGALMRVASDIPAELAATVAINPCTALRMLTDFVKLKPGDVVIQNGSNSAVGVAVIQLAREMGVRTINIIRDRPDLPAVVERLKELGADVVVTEEMVPLASMQQLLDERFGKVRPVLGLNCVGGTSASNLSRHLADHAPLVTYGGMSRKPVTISTGSLIFNDIVARGFWLSRWTDEHSVRERSDMIRQITDLIRDGKFSTPVERKSFAELHGAILRAKEGFRSQKVVLEFDDDATIAAHEKAVIA